MRISVARRETTGRLLDCPSTASVACHVPFGRVSRLADPVDGPGPWWLEVAPPAGAPAGEYSGCLEIDGERVDVSVRVWAFMMPRSSFPVYVGLNHTIVRTMENGNPAMYDHYVGELAVHGIDRGMVLPVMPHDTATGAARPNVDYLKSLPPRPLHLLSCPFRLDEPDKLRMYLHLVGVAWSQARSDTLGVYFVDEPNGRSDEGRRRQADARAIHELLQSIKSPIVSVIPGSAADLAEVPVDLPVYFWGREYPTERPHWVYTALDNRGKAPTWLSTAPPADYVASFAAAFATGVHGIWYWTAVQAKPFEAGGRLFAGEGRLLMPGPTATAGLKLIREGQNIYAMLSMITDRDQALRLAGVIAPSFACWLRDLDEIYRVKDLVGELLEGER